MLSMRSLKDILKESILDDIDTQINKGDKDIKHEIKAFLKENFKGASSCKISKKPNADGLYEVSSPKNIEVITNKNITSFTNGMFIWTKVDGNFKFYSCLSLKSLVGSPKEVGGDFDCRYCRSLKSLVGAPKEVGGDFIVRYCQSLESLEGAPKEVGKSFYCYSCSSLTSLVGAPKEVVGNFVCGECDSLESLEGAPKEVGREFYCRGCKVKFTKDDVKNVSNVKGVIIC